MQVRESYDLIVIGDQLGGLFLAAGAAQAGRKVLVLEESSVPTVSYEIPSGRFLGDFGAEPLIGLQEGAPIDSFLKSLGLYQKLDDLFPLHDPPLQIVGDRFRLDFSYREEKLAGELQLEFPESALPLKRLLSGSIPRNGSFSQAVADAGLPVFFELFGSLQPALFGSMAPTDLSYPAYKEVISLASRSVRYPMGGRSALKERLISRMQIFGGTLKRSTRVEEIVFEKNRLAGVLLSSYEGFVRAPVVVGAMGARTFFELIPAEYQSSRLAESVKGISPRYWRMSFTLLVPERSIPEGMGSHLVLTEGEDCLQLQLFPKEVYGGIPPEHRAVVVRTLVPYDPSTLTEQAIARHLRRCLHRIVKVIPFLRSGPLRVSPDPDRLAQDPAFLRYYRFKDLDHIPPAFLAFESGLSGSMDQRDYLDWSRFGLPGLALCSRDIYPLFGSTGEILAAMDLLSLLERWSQRRKK